ncbi:hypothetical protein SODALDRAFT_52676 [Sodiomyces alkalinus F11]|uniref:Uncharacterized protein n=1 Tax=Sodiomyces alkalinus (strain CBS 110278 / VKM F-3762 / F11) TaxID=1314773 RepID=A0A3N2PN53_SODAK|nr:hypothetical protein SODALDRAFT_52676 [Sodiomyces alkalinus F11]ROT35854.1 hypothetical protein SODALDRAFT_52676 [Sodiomyces alkalinus F11]
MASRRRHGHRPRHRHRYRRRIRCQRQPQLQRPREYVQPRYGMIRRCSGLLEKLLVFHRYEAVRLSPSLRFSSSVCALRMTWWFCYYYHSTTSGICSVFPRIIYRACRQLRFCQTCISEGRAYHINRMNGDEDDFSWPAPPRRGCINKKRKRPRILRNPAISRTDTYFCRGRSRRHYILCRTRVELGSASNRIGIRVSLSTVSAASNTGGLHMVRSSLAYWAGGGRASISKHTQAY